MTTRDESEAVKAIGRDIARSLPPATPEPQARTLGGAKFQRIIDYYGSSEFDDRRRASRQASQLAQVWRAAPLSSDTSQALDSLQDAYESIGVDPVLANQIAGSTWGLLASPEIIMGLRSEFGLEGSRVSEWVLDDLTNGQIREGAAQRFEEDMVGDGGLTARWLQDNRWDFKGQDRDLILTALAALNDQPSRAKVVSLARAYTDATPLTSDKERIKFLLHFWGWAQAEQQRDRSRDTGFGTLGTVLEAPFNLVMDQVIKPAYLSLVTSDDEYAWREPMSFGQNIAITTGTDPSDGMRWQLTSGSVDFLSNFAFDPINVAFGLGIGLKFARGAAATGRIAGIVKSGGFFARSSGAIQSLIPFYGKGLSNMTRFSRGGWARFGYALFSKTADDLIEKAGKADVFKEIIRIADNGGGAQDFIELWPSFSKIAEGLGELLTKANLDSIRTHGLDAEQYVADVFRAGMGGITGGSYRKIEQLLENDVIMASAVHRDLTRAALINGEVSPRTAQFADEGIDGAQMFTVRLGDDLDEAVWGDDALDIAGEVALKVIGEAAGSSVIVFPGRVKTLDLTNPDQMRNLIHWLSRHPIRKEKTSAVVRLERLLTQMVAEEIGGMSGLVLQRALKAQPEMMDVLLRYAEPRRYDMIGSEGVSVVTGFGANRAIRTVDGIDLPSFIAHLPDTKMQLAATRSRVWKEANGPKDVWHVVDLPHKVPTLGVKRAWRVYGSKGGSNNWWARAKTNMFTPAAQDAIVHTNGIEGMRSLGGVLARLRMPADDIKPIMNAYLEATPFRRQQITMDAFEQAAIHVDDPFLKYQILEFYRSTGNRGFAKGADGLEIGMRRASESPLDPTKARPIPVFPEHFSNKTPLPNTRELFRSLRRYRAAKGGRAPKWWYQGLPHWNPNKGTRNARKQLVEAYAAHMRKRGVDVDALDPNTLSAMAYGTTFKRTAVQGASELDGFGHMARLGNMLHAQYRKAFKLFAISQLVTRPIAWASRVVLLEEGWRAGMFDMPSFYRNPGRWMRHFNDATIVGRVSKWKERTAINAQQISADLFSPFTDSGDIAKASDAVRGVLPEFFDGNTRVYGTIGELRRGVGRYLHREVVRNANMGVLAGNLTPSGLAQWKARRVQVGTKRMKELGLDPNFVWDDASEIMRKGIGYEYIEHTAPAIREVKWADNLHAEDLRRYATAYADTLSRMVGSRVNGRFGLNRLVERAGHGTTKFGARELIADSIWRDTGLAANVRDMARHRMVSDTVLADDLLLAEWYLDEVVDPHVWNMLSPLWNRVDDYDEAARIAAAIIDTKRVRLTDGTVLNFKQDQLRGLTETMRTRVIPQRSGDPNAFPLRLSHQVNPFFSASAETRKVSDYVKAMSDWTLAFAGDKISQRLNRRPAWIATFNDHFKSYTALGMTDEVARSMASTEASRLVNYVFYNTDNVTPFLMSMNRTIPYFTAWFEVSQVWAYKIPAMAAGGIGYPMMVRKIDRVLDALTNMGILTWDDDKTEGSPIGTRRANLHLSRDLNTQNPFANLMSRAAFEAVSTPSDILNHFFGILNLGNDPEHGDAAYFDRDTWTFNVGNPVDIWSSGIGAVNQGYQVGANPFLAAGMSFALNEITEQVDFKKESALAGETLQEVADRLEVSVSELIFDNREILSADEVIGADILEGFDRGGIQPNELILGADLTLKIPHSNMWVSLLEDVLLPFGRTETPTGWLMDWVPNPVERMAQGLFGIHFGVKLPEGDKEVDGILPGIVQMGFTPFQQSQFAGEFKTALAYLENHRLDHNGNGIMSRVVAKQQELADFLATIPEMILQDGSAAGSPNNVSLAPGSPEDEQFRRLTSSLDRLESEMITDAADIAYSAMFMRGIVGNYAPGTPVMRSEEQRNIEAYWYGKNLQEAEERGEDVSSVNLPDLIREAGDSNFEATLALTAEWLSGDVRSSAMRHWVKENVPDLWPYVFPATYWGPAGEPPLGRTLDQWSEDVGQDKTKWLDPGVFMMRQQFAAIDYEYERKIVDLMGNDPAGQFTFMLNNWATAKELRLDHNVDKAGLMYWDDFFNDGAYKDWKDRNVDDPYSILTAADEFGDKLITAIDQLIQPNANILMLDPQQRKEQVGLLKATLANVRDAINGWRDQYTRDEDRRPRDALLGSYFDEVITPYYDHLSTLYEKLDATTNSEDQSDIYGEIANWQNTEGMSRGTVNGISVPGPLEFQWSGMTEEDRSNQLLVWAAMPTKWLSRNEAMHLEEEFPQLAEMLPTTPTEWKDYEDFNDARTEIARRSEPDAEGNVEMTTSQARKAQSNLNDWLENQLAIGGRLAEQTYRDMSPLQRLDIMGELSPALAAFIPEVNAVLNQLDLIEKGPLSGQGERWFGIVQGHVQEQMAVNPALWTEIKDLGERLFDEGTLDSIIMRLFAGSDSEFAEL